MQYVSLFKNGLYTFIVSYTMLYPKSCYFMMNIAMFKAAFGVYRVFGQSYKAMASCLDIQATSPN
jgi:hypothetical protein